MLTPSPPRLLSLLGRRAGALPGVRPTAPRRFIIDTSYSAHFMDFKGSSIPSSMKKLVVAKLSQDFREAVSVRTVAVPTPGDAELLVRNRESVGGLRLASGDDGEGDAALRGAGAAASCLPFRAARSSVFGWNQARFPTDQHRLHLHAQAAFN